MKSTMVIQLTLFFGFFVVPQLALVALGGETTLPAATWICLGVWAAITCLYKSDWVPVERRSFLQVNPTVKRLVMVSYITLQAVDALAVIAHGHQILYLEPRPSTASYFLPLKLIGAGGIYLAVICLAQAEKLSEEPLSIVTVASTAAVGSRGLLFFNLLSILLMRQGLKGVFKVKYLFALLPLLVSFVLLGVVRESQSLELEPLEFLYVQSLNEFAEVNTSTADYRIPPGLVFTQFPSLVTGQIDESRVTYQLTSNANPTALDSGYGISSSGYGEFLILFGRDGEALYFIAPLLYSLGLFWLARSRFVFVRSLAPALLPYVLYMVRAELLFPWVMMLKALIGLGVAAGLSHLADRRRPATDAV